MTILSLVFNSLAIVAIAKDTNRTPLCTMILHVSIADIVVSLFCLGGEAIWSYTVEWEAGNIGCKGVKYSQVGNVVQGLMHAVINQLKQILSTPKSSVVVMHEVMEL